MKLNQAVGCLSAAVFLFVSASEAIVRSLYSRGLLVWPFRFEGDAACIVFAGLLWVLFGEQKILCGQLEWVGCFRFGAVVVFSGFIFSDG